MINREKVIKALEEMADYYWGKYESVTDAITLLKEQPEIVRCLDCHYHDAGQNESEGWNRCRLHRIPTNDDEFCSWGVEEND